MAINFPDNRDQLVPPQPSGPIETGDVYVYLGTTYTATVLSDSSVRWDAAVSAGSDAYVLKVGDTMTGQLTLPGGGTGSEAATVDQIPAALWQRDNTASRLTPATAGDSVAVVNADQAVFTVGEGLDGSGSNHLGVYYGNQITGADSADLFTSNGDLRIRTDGNGAVSTAVVRFISGFAGHDGTVQIAPGTGNITTTGDVQTTSLNSGPLSGFRNAIINGNVIVRQRSETTANSYVADRWFTATAGCGTANSGPDGVGLKRVITIPAAGGFIRQALELDNPNRQSQFAPASTWTARVWATSQPQLRLSFRKTSGDATDESEILAFTDMTAGSTVDGFTEYTHTITIPDVTANVQTNQLQTLVIWFQSNGAAASFTGMSFEPGPVASPYEVRPIQTELALCQRYYQTTNYVVMSYTNSSSSGNTAMNGIWQYATSMRATPSITVGNTVNVNGIASSPLANACRFGATGVSAGNADIRDITANAEL